MGHDGYHSTRHRKVKPHGFMPCFREGQGVQQISSPDPALDLLWSSGGRRDLPHQATEGKSSLCLSAEIPFNIHCLHTSQLILVPDPLRPPWCCWHPHSWLGAAAGNFPDGASSMPLKPQTSGWGQHSPESKLGEETSRSPPLPRGVCSVSSSSTSAWCSRWQKCSWFWTRAWERFLWGD